MKFKKKESENYIFHYLNDSLAEKEIDLIIAEQEQVIKDLQEFFKIKVPFKIQYYLLNTSKQVGRFYGDEGEYNGFVKYPDKIYAVYNKEVQCIGYHEDAHIVSDLINKPNLSFIREGLAMYFDQKWWDKNNEDWVFEFLGNDKYIKVAELMYDQDIDLKCEITYPIAGSFTKFLINTYGKEKYLELYRNKIINHNTFPKIYAKPLIELEQEFLNYIKTKANLFNKTI